jgi:GT2 family glycosyltransferase
MPSVDILLPTCNRLTSLIMTLSGVAAQTVRDMRVIVADQSQEPVGDAQVVQTLLRLLKVRGGRVEWYYRRPVHGIAEQRDFLLKKATADAVLYLDDDVLMEPWVIEQLLEILDAEQCGFVGAFPVGLSHLDDVRPEQQHIEYWDGPVSPEVVDPGSPQWERWQLHRAANLYHVSRSIAYEAGPRPRLYKVAWIASCVLYDRAKLLEVGGFSFWPLLPRYHSGEEVLVQNLLMRRWGGCAIVPSGTYYSQVPSTVLNDAGTVDGHALALLPEMVERYVSSVKTTP